MDIATTMFQLLASAGMLLVFLIVLFCMCKNPASAACPVAVLGVAVLLYLAQGLLNGANFGFHLGSENATMTMSVDAAELQLIKAQLAELEQNLFGARSNGTGGRLSSLVSTLRDFDRVEVKLQEIKDVLQNFRDNGAVAEEFLERQALRAEALAKASVSRVMELVTEETFWQQLAPRLASAGLLKDMDPELVVRVEAERARVQEELRIKAGVAESVERVRAEGWIRLAAAVSEDFDQSLPYRAAVLLAVCLGIACLGLAYQLLLRRLKIPPLVDESSLSGVSWRSCSRRALQPDVLAELFAGDVLSNRPEIILTEAVKESVGDMALVAARAAGTRLPRLTQAGNCPALALPNAVFFGPPGTGKSLTARRLALACGMDYAIMSGGNVLGLQEEAVPELRRIFSWAKRSPFGLVLFIDEAEAFLSARGGASSPHVQAAVSFFLVQTGTSSERLMVILATNRLQDLDEAVLSRLPFQIEFGRPSSEMLTRQIKDRCVRLPRQAADRLLGLLKEQDALFDEQDDAKGLHSLGFSGRDVQSLFEEFSRRWSLEQETDGKRKADKAWLQRWLELKRSGRRPTAPG